MQHFLLALMVQKIVDFFCVCYIIVTKSVHFQGRSSQIAWGGGAISIFGRFNDQNERILRASGSLHLEISLWPPVEKFLRGTHPIESVPSIDLINCWLI